jgi:S-formylglutathione hydrolase FrmB
VCPLIGSPDARFRLLVLPVSDDDVPTFGDPVREIETWAVTSGRAVIVHFPQFDSGFGFWYGNHDTDSSKQFEAATLVMLDAWDKGCAAAGLETSPPIVMGFSRSGYGAMSLMARHPSRFSGVIAWDAPFMLHPPGSTQALQETLARAYATTYGSESNFTANYQLTNHPDRLSALAGTSIVIGGYKLWGVQTEDFHDLLMSLNIPHAFLFRSYPTHRWDSGWIGPCLDAATGSLPPSNEGA